MAKQPHKIAGINDAIRYGRGVTKVSIAITGGNTLTLSASDCGLSTEEFALKINAMIDECMAEPTPAGPPAIEEDESTTENEGE